MQQSFFRSLGSSLLITLMTTSLIGSELSLAAQTPLLSSDNSSLQPTLSSEISPFIQELSTEDTESYEILMSSNSDALARQMDEADPDEEDSSSNYDTDESAKDPKSPLPDALYNPNMNYGKGAPKPKPAPLSTKKRNLVFFALSVIMASVAMSIASSGSGRDAPGTTTH